MAKKKKNPKRVAAGKKAWAKKSATSKAKSVRVLKGANPKTGGNPGGKKGGGRTAAKKGTRKKSKQGVVSWAVNVITLAIASSNVAVRIAESWNKPEGEKFEWFARTMLSDHAGLIFGPGMEYVGFEAKRLIRGYAPMAGAYAFKTGMSHVLKKVKIQSLIPGR